MPRKRKARLAPSESSPPEGRRRSNELGPSPDSNMQRAAAPDCKHYSRNNTHPLPGHAAHASLLEAQSTHTEQVQHDTTLLQSVLHQLSGSFHSINTVRSLSSSHSYHSSSSAINLLSQYIFEILTQSNPPATQQTSSLLPLLQMLIEGNQTRCLHCRHIPQLAKTKGAVYFPFKIDNIYQASQNLAAVHLCDNCPNIPASLKAELQRLAKEPKSTAGGGKKYWSEGIRVAGIVEDAEGRLQFK